MKCFKIKRFRNLAPPSPLLNGIAEVCLMATSVYDWMLAGKRAPPEQEDGVVSGSVDILVRILKSLDQAASRTTVSST